MGIRNIQKLDRLMQFDGRFFKFCEPNFLNKKSHEITLFLDLIENNTCTLKKNTSFSTLLLFESLVFTEN